MGKKPYEFVRQGKRIQNRRKELGWSQEEFAEILGSSQTQVSRWERGEIIPGSDYLERVADKLDVDTGYILLQQDQKRLIQQDNISDEEAELLDALRIGDAGKAVEIMNLLLKKTK